MTNEQKYKTAEERVRAFNKKCGPCEVVNCDRVKAIVCYNNWLALEAVEEKPEPCPFCGRSVNTFITSINGSAVHGISCFCGYRKSMPRKIKMETVIAAHNRVARAVNNYKNKEA